MINRFVSDGGSMVDTPQCVGLIVIGAIGILALMRYVFEGT